MRTSPESHLASEGLLALKLTSPFYIAPSDLSNVSSRLIDALSSQSADDMKELEQVLSQAIRQLLREAEPAVVETVKGSRQHRSAAEAYSIGQVAFAQRFAASVVNRRVDDVFLRELNDQKWLPYLRELFAGDRTNVALARATSQAEETVSRKIRELRQLGITDFRKEGTFVVNFLTPVARQLLGAHQLAQATTLDGEFSESQSAVSEFLTKIKCQTPAFLRHAQSFANGGSLSVSADES